MTWIEPLESRCLLSASPMAVSPAHVSDPSALSVALERKKPDLLHGNIIGSYFGTYRLGNLLFAGSEDMTITSQTTRSFAGTLMLDAGPALPFSAKLSPRTQVPSLGFGWKFTFSYKNGKKTNLHLLGEFQADANGFIVQMTGKLYGKAVPKPHGEMNLSPADPSTFLR